MLNRGVLSLVVVALALLAPPVSAAPITWLVGADAAACGGQVPDSASIFEALLGVNSGDTIHVCPGDYTEDSMLIPAYKDHLTIEGSGTSRFEQAGVGSGRCGPA